MKNEITVQGESGRKYEVRTRPYGDNNVEIILTFAGLVVSCGIRPLSGKDCDKGIEDIIERAEKYTISIKLNNNLTYHD